MVYIHTTHPHTHITASEMNRQAITESGAFDVLVDMLRSPLDEIQREGCLALSRLAESGAYVCCMCVCVCMYMYVCVPMCVYVCMYVCVSMCVYVCMYVCCDPHWTRYKERAALP